MPKELAWPAQSIGVMPEVRHYLCDTTNGAEICPGSLVFVSSNELELCGSDPSDILGVALEFFQGHAGYGMPNSPSQVTGRTNQVAVAIASQSQIFTMPCSSAPAATDIGVRYGVAIVNDGSWDYWVVDKTDTTNERVVVVDVDIDRGIAYVKFLEAYAQWPGEVLA